jgi:Flp pilus assembly protein TadD
VKYNFYPFYLKITGSATMHKSPPFSSPGIQAVAKYNPHLWGPEELKAIFVVRQRELALLHDAIKRAQQGHAPQHILLIGQRGMGKTTLLQRIALQIEEDDTLNQDWLALRFPEEQYTVSNLAELWGNVLGALADTLEAQGKSTLLIDQNLLLLDSLPVEQREKRTLDLINQWCEENKQRLLLLIDSTDMLFDNLSENKKSKKDASSLNLWRLRKTLQSNPNLFWLGGSYQALEASDLYHDAFQDFFQLVELKPLTLEEIRQAMRAMARTFGTGRGITGAAAEKEIMQALTERPERLKTLRQLTGGNPRTTVMLFELFAAGGSDQVRSDLERLLDMMTPLYKARLEVMPDQQRKILAHIMESWQPISLGELAKVSGLENTRASPQLVRMEKDGLVIKAPLPNTSRSGYQAAERFFNIWYLMRNAPRRLKLRLAWLVEFMRLWYNHDELEQIAHQRMKTHSHGNTRLDDLEYSRAIASAMPSGNQTRLALDYQVFKQLQAQKKKLSEFFDFDGDDKPFQSIEEYNQRFKALRKKSMLMPQTKTEEEKTAFSDLLMTSFTFSIDDKESIVGRTLSKIEFNDLLEILQDEEKLWHEFAGIEESTKMKDLIISQEFHFSLPNKEISLMQIENHLIGSPFFYWYMTDLYWKKHQDISVDQMIINGMSKKYNVNLNSGSLIYIAELINDRQENPEVDMAFTTWFDYCLKEANSSLLNKLGVVLESKSNRYDESEQAYRKAIELDGNCAALWANLGYLLIIRLNRFEEAEQAYRKAIELDKNDSSPCIYLGDLLCDHLNRYEEAEQAYLKAIELDGNDGIPWNNLGILLGDHLNRYEEAEQAYRKAIDLDKNDAGPWYNLGILLSDHLNRYEEAEQTYRKAIELNENDVKPWNNLGNLLCDHLNRYEEAEQAYRKAIELDKNDNNLWHNLGCLLSDKLNRYEEAEQAYRKAIELDESIPNFWSSLGCLLGDNLNRKEEAEEAYLNAIKLTKTDPYVYCNLARLNIRQNKNDLAESNFRRALPYAEDEPHLLLQCHLWLNNLDLANLALTQLAEKASQGNNEMFFRIKELCWESQPMGLGLALAQLMADNVYAEFLKPFELALRKVNGDSETIKGAPLEIQQLAEDIALDITLKTSANK